MKLNFQEQIEKDLKATFFNLASMEFATEHSIDDDIFAVVVDNERLHERKIKDDIENVYLGDMLFFIPKTVLGYAPKVDTSMSFDGIDYQVSSVNDDSGMLEITLMSNFGR